MAWPAGHWHHPDEHRGDHFDRTLGALEDGNALSSPTLGRLRRSILRTLVVAEELLAARLASRR